MISLRDSTSGKALALAIGVLVLGAAHFGVIAPLISHYESTAQRLLERQELVRRYQKLRSRSPAFASGGSSTARPIVR